MNQSEWNKLKLYFFFKYIQTKKIEVFYVFLKQLHISRDDIEISLKSSIIQ